MPSQTATKLKRITKRLMRIAESDDAFALDYLRQLERILGENGTDPEWVSQLRALDYRAYAREHGIEALRILLDDFNSTELKDYARERGLVKGGVSKLTKGDLVNRIVIAAKAA
jgi:hypothetical protein